MGEGHDNRLLTIDFKTTSSGHILVSDTKFHNYWCKNTCTVAIQ